MQWGAAGHEWDVSEDASTTVSENSNEKRRRGGCLTRPSFLGYTRISGFEKLPRISQSVDQREPAENREYDRHKKTKENAKKKNEKKSRR